MRWDLLSDDERMMCGCAILAVCAVAGVVAGLAFLFLFDVVLERVYPLKPGQTVISHGLTALLTTFPICLALGFAGGVAAGLSLLRQPFAALSVFSLTAICLLYTNVTLWQSWIDNYGRDYAEYTLFYPPMVLAAAIALLLAPALLWGFFARSARASGLSQRR